MAGDLIQRARDIAADSYIRMEMKNPTEHRSAREWADHVATYAKYIREGAYDQGPDVQAVIVALRSVGGAL